MSMNEVAVGFVDPAFFQFIHQLNAMENRNNPSTEEFEVPLWLMLALQGNHFMSTTSAVSHFPTNIPGVFGHMISNPNIHAASVSQTQPSINICDCSSETVSTTEYNSSKSEIVSLARREN